MKKFFTIALASLATLFTITLASSFIAANAENSICIESVDGTPLGISLGAAQVRGLHDVLPEQYRTGGLNLVDRGPSINDEALAFSCKGFFSSFSACSGAVWG